MYAFSPSTISQDWQLCYEAHAAARDQWALCSAFDPELARPFFDHLHLMATAFKSVHGREFDPKTPIVVAEPYETAEEARDFDFSVEAHHSEMRKEAYGLPSYHLPPACSADSKWT